MVVGRKRDSVETTTLEMSGVARHPHTSINDLVPHHLISGGTSLLFIDPIRLIPVVVRNQTKVNGCIRQDLDSSVFRRQQPKEGTEGERESKANTHDLNSSVNSSSFKNTYGY